MLRYWDGAAWTEHRSPQSSTVTPPASAADTVLHEEPAEVGKARRRGWLPLLALLVLAAGVGALFVLTGGEAEQANRLPTSARSEFVEVDGQVIGVASDASAVVYRNGEDEVCRTWVRGEPKGEVDCLDEGAIGGRRVGTLFGEGYWGTGDTPAYFDNRNFLRDAVAVDFEAGRAEYVEYESSGDGVMFASVLGEDDDGPVLLVNDGDLTDVRRGDGSTLTRLNSVLVDAAVIDGILVIAESRGDTVRRIDGQQEQEVSVSFEGGILAASADASRVVLTNLPAMRRLQVAAPIVVNFATDEAHELPLVADGVNYSTFFGAGNNIVFGTFVMLAEDETLLSAIELDESGAPIGDWIVLETWSNDGPSPASLFGHGVGADEIVFPAQAGQGYVRVELGDFASG